MNETNIPEKPVAAVSEEATASDAIALARNSSSDSKTATAIAMANDAIAKASAGAEDDKPGVIRRAAAAVNRTLYNEETAQASDNAVVALKHGHLGEMYKEGWRANVEAVHSIEDKTKALFKKLGLRQAESGPDKGQGR